MPAGDWQEDEADWDEADDFEPDDDEAETVACPYCERDIHEDAVRCPRCGAYLSREDAPPARKPWWIVLGALVCLLIVYYWITQGF